MLFAVILGVRLNIAITLITRNAEQLYYANFINKGSVTMRIQTNITDDDFEILTDFCVTERVSVSAIMNALVTDFLDTTDTEYRKKITNEALKIRQGRPKGV